MEIFDSSTSQNQTVRKVTLRHPWHDVYLTWNRHLNIRGCSGGEGRNQKCSNPPYMYLEKWRANASRAAANSCFKIRLMTSKKANESAQMVAYLHVTRRTWELKLRTQKSILTKVLTTTAWRAWHGVLNHVFTDSTNRRRKRAKRLRRCAIDLAAIRHRFIRRVHLTTIQQEVKRSLKKNKNCLLRNNSTFVNSITLINQIPWKTMTSRMKSTLTCHISALVQQLLRSHLLELAGARCVRGRRWGQMGETQRRSLLNRSLAAGWRRWEGKAQQKLSALVAQQLDDEITTFCADELT